MIELNKRTELSLPEGTISQSGIHEIMRLITSQQIGIGQWQALNPDTELHYLPPLPANWQWQWLITARGDYVGTMPKRVRKYYRKAHGLKSPDTFIEEVGNVARRHSDTHLSYTFEFVSEFDWDAGDFGDRGSCYWGDHAQARDMLRDNGALAIRFYSDTGRGKARAWIVEIPFAPSPYYILFNGHGFPGDPTLVIARVFAHFVGMNYYKIRVTNNGAPNGMLWIDGGKGYVICDQSHLEQGKMASYDFDFVEPYRCESCGDAITHDNMYYGSDSNCYCEQCFYEVFETCSYCGETHYHEDITFVDYDYYCEACLDSQCVQCNKCKEHVHKSDANSIEASSYCDNCYDDALKEQAGKA